MKKVLAIILLSSLFTGCAQVGKYAQNRLDPLGSAKEDCQSLGFRVGTQDYGSCVQRLYASKQQYNASVVQSQNRMINSMKTTQCHQSGSYITCNEF